MYYRLNDNNEPEPCEAKDVELGTRVGLGKYGDYVVSTVFLGIDHRFGPDGPPLVFETMIFPKGDMTEEWVARYSTYQEALDGHIFACNIVREAIARGTDDLYEVEEELRACMKEEE